MQSMNEINWCKDGRHIGVNNTTGKCPMCGEQVESPSVSGFSKVLLMDIPKQQSRCMYDNFKPEDGLLGLVCNCPKCTRR